MWWRKEEGAETFFEGLVKAFAVFRSRPRPISFHRKCVQCAGALNWLLVQSCPHRKGAVEWKEDTEEAAMYLRARHVLSVMGRSVSVGGLGWPGSGGKGARRVER